MELKLRRLYCKDSYTIGKLYIDDVYFCDTIEDRERVLKSVNDKVYGETAIPRGKYRLVLSWSNRFKRLLPEIKDVPFFEGIRIHRGNTAHDSSGCVIVGENKKKGEVIQSAYYEAKLVQRLQEAQQAGDIYHYIHITS